MRMHFTLLPPSSQVCVTYISEKSPTSKIQSLSDSLTKGAFAFWSLQTPRNWLPFHSGWVSEQHPAPGTWHSTSSLVLSFLVQPVPCKHRKWDPTKSSDVFGCVLQAGWGAMRNPPPHLERWELSWSRGLGWPIPWRSAFFSSAPLILHLCGFFCNLLGK